MPSSLSPMEPSAPMILPKGIVVNTHTIYDQVAEYSTLPLDKVFKIWQVYTTTNKKLQDPTARRLENFWWHVLGSDRQHLSGRALAKLFEEISVGPTFVPLRGPPNRWEGPETVIPSASIHSSNDVAGKQIRSSSHEPPTTSRSGDGREPGTKILSSSALKPPPTHPILKKTRVASSSGPRPTARFVSPHESANEEEDDKESDALSSGSTSTATPATSSEMKPSTSAPPYKKRSSKKFVASSASKRRPHLPKRASSQSSGTSENGASSFGSGLGAGARNSGAIRPVSPIPEKPSTSTTPQSHEDKLPSASHPLPPGMSEKAAGKRPVAPVIKTRTELSPTASYPKESAQSDSTSNVPAASAVKHKPSLSDLTPAEKTKAPGRKSQHPNRITPSARSHYAEPPAPSPKAVISQVQSMVDLTSHRRRMSQHPPAPFPYGGVPDATSHPSEADDSGMMSRSRSHQGYEWSKQFSSSTGSSGGRRKPSNAGLFTKTTASTTNVAAMGTIIDQSGVGSLPTTSAGMPRVDSADQMGGLDMSQSHMIPKRLSSTSLLDAAKMTPTQPSASASVPLGRTMSQLTLLLEREKSRTGGNSKSRSKS